MAQTVKNPPAMQKTWVRSLGWEDPLEEGLATFSSVPAWRIPWTEEPGGLQSMGSQSRIRLSSSSRGSVGGEAPPFFTTQTLRGAGGRRPRKPVPRARDCGWKPANQIHGARFLIFKGEVTVSRVS